MELYGGIDLGGTFIKAAAVDADGNIRGRVRLATGVAEGKEAVLERMAQALTEAAAEAGGKLIAAGVGVPGLVSPAGRILRFPNFPGWDGFDLCTALRRQLGLPAVIDNDANAAAVAEGQVGAARGQSHYVFITLGTGVGAGIVMEGHLLRGPHGKAGEIGHVKVIPAGRPCGCGARGCVEQYASGTALRREAEAAVEAGRLPHPAEGEEITPAWLHGLAAAGHSNAGSIFQEAGRILGIALAAVVNTLDITVFYIGGGVGAAFDVLQAPLRRSVEELAFGLDPADLVLAAATCGNDAGMIGAAYLARQAATVEAAGSSAGWTKPDPGSSAPPGMRAPRRS